MMMGVGVAMSKGGASTHASVCVCVKVQSLIQCHVRIEGSGMLGSKE